MALVSLDTSNGVGLWILKGWSPEKAKKGWLVSKWPQEQGLSSWAFTMQKFNITFLIITLHISLRVNIGCFTSKVFCHERSVKSDDCQQSNSPEVEAMLSLLSPPSSPPPPSQEPPSSLPPPSQEHVASLSPERASCNSSSSAWPPPLDCFPPPHSPSSLALLACNKLPQSWGDQGQHLAGGGRLGRLAGLLLMLIVLLPHCFGQDLISYASLPNWF